ncbi:MAG: anthranilate synthase component I family protein [Nitrospirales bacterium]|nr:anthranilate synthase component I family protein [Nitrospira sp.]MDR4500586.1 anthranilate synthase component I family protein [Nitrospirales bacterium]
MSSSSAWSTRRFLHATSAEPLSLSVPLPCESPFELYVRLTGCSPPSFLLESGGENPAIARYSIIGCDPYRTFSAKENRYEVWNKDGTISGKGDTFSALTEFFTISPYKRSPHLPPFLGGAVGFLSYDMVRGFECLPSEAVDDLDVPDMWFMFVELAAVLDHVDQALHFIFSPDPRRWLGESRDQLVREGKSRILEWQERLQSVVESVDLSLDRRAGVPRIQSQQSRKDYVHRVRECQDFIAAGDIYQANLSHRFSVDLTRQKPFSPHVQGAQWYQKIREVNPSPFSGLFLFEDYALVSNSPERLVRSEGQRVDIRPIAGTRPRGSTLTEDRRFIEELLASPKERAEHLMLVDLARNDLGRVCRYGTIAADQFMRVERYSHVSHLVSNVAGLLREGLTAFDVLRASFPGGTITGVPKVHCMEIIERLEPVRRGVYTGSLGYISWSGDMDMNILIRTLLLTKERGYLQVGAGIVADSNPDQEYDETVHKAQAFFQAFTQKDAG